MKLYGRLAALALVGLLTACALLVSGIFATTATAGPGRGKVEADFATGTYEQGSISASVLITATELPGETTNTKGNTFTLYYDSKVLSFIGHNDGLPCRTEKYAPMKYDRAYPADSATTCEQVPGKKVKQDRFYMGVLANAPLGGTKATASAWYGNVNTSTANVFAADIIAGRPVCARSDFNANGFCIPNEFSFLVDALRRAMKPGGMSDAEKRQLVLDFRSQYFWKDFGRLAAHRYGRNAIPFVSQFVSTYLANQGRAS